MSFIDAIHRGNVRFSGAIIYPGNPSLCGSAPEDFTIYGDYSADMDHYSDEHFRPTDVFGLLVQNEVACKYPTVCFGSCC